MYLYNATGDNNRVDRSKDTYMSRTIGGEILNATISRKKLRDTTNAKLQMKGPRLAAAVQRAEMIVLRKQLNAFPEQLREEARTTFILDQNNKRKELQDYQCFMIGRLESVLREKMTENGVDYRKYRIGGFDKGTYERFFRVEPGRHMSKAQLVTALRRSFGDNVIKSEASVSKLFDSFDYRRTDEMDWRAFLYLLTIMLQPSLPCTEHLKWAYAIYSSFGSLDMDCCEKLSVGMVKDMLCVPILLSMRAEVRNAFDIAWMHLSTVDSEAIQLTRSPPPDPDDIVINYRLFKKILTETKFARYMQIATVFGKKDTRMWSFLIEERYFHPTIRQKIKTLRREVRSNEEADAFIARKALRRKTYSFLFWQQYLERRRALRFCCIAMEIRSQIGSCGRLFDHWKKYTIALLSALTIQRLVRGFLARSRRRFIRSLQLRVIKMQAGTRKALVRIKFRQQRERVRWAARTIQRIVRGFQAKRRVQTIVMELYDNGKRRLAMERADWQYGREMKAAASIQMLVKKFMRRRRTMKRLEQERMQEMVERQMKEQDEKSRVENNVYKQELAEWYRRRKEEYDRTVLNERQTATQKKAILQMRNRRAAQEKEELRLRREEQLQRVEEERIEIWIKEWEDKIQRAADDKRRQCNNCLVLPETPEDLQLKKNLQKAAKKRLKEVLRRADKQKIPMELPEANEIALKEAIEGEYEAAIARGKEEMRTEATRLQREKEAKEKYQHEQELKQRRRKRKSALINIQCHARVFLARKRGRAMAYRRYRRLFDPESHEYYYEDLKTHVTTWKKPVLLGSYDVEMDEEQWVTMHDSNGERYYYNPATWEQSWDQPQGTMLCQICGDAFCTAYHLQDQLCYCETHFNERCQKMVFSEGYNPKDIYFKPFEGNRTDAAYLDFDDIPEATWYSLLNEVDAHMKLSAEEEQELAEQELKRATKLRLQKSLSGSASSSASFSFGDGVKDGEIGVRAGARDEEGGDKGREKLPNIGKPSRAQSAADLKASSASASAAAAAAASKKGTKEKVSKKGARTGNGIYDDDSDDDGDNDDNHSDEDFGVRATLKAWGRRGEEDDEKEEVEGGKRRRGRSRRRESARADKKAGRGRSASKDKSRSKSRSKSKVKDKSTSQSKSRSRSRARSADSRNSAGKKKEKKQKGKERQKAASGQVNNNSNNNNKKKINNKGKRAGSADSRSRSKSPVKSPKTKDMKKNDASKTKTKSKPSSAGSLASPKAAGFLRSASMNFSMTSNSDDDEKN